MMYRIRKIDIDFNAGTDIKDAIKEAILYSRNNFMCDVSFNFNGIACVINGDSREHLAIDQYHRRLNYKVTGRAD